MKSLKIMIDQLDGLQGTRDLTEWENRFVGDIVDKVADADGDARQVTPKQVLIIERIWGTHFA